MKALNVGDRVTVIASGYPDDENLNRNCTITKVFRGEYMPYELDNSSCYLRKELKPDVQEGYNYAIDDVTEILKGEV
jgi:hypothetical protein